ncbi:MULTISPECIES: SPOR domain-containing protein [Vibrio]|uniref:SPOR domain-containing protein n=1 Tax=Vibrio chemaguriensis TaxID=2527672 RepID=A0ABX1I1M6_9VIBR|nr:MULTISPECIES: SPOR domain-containing protein [Vibrio]MCS0303824.1 SPOR domain-containing protein [Vibrio diabolicus]NKJ70092.1 SPOR domain-containing protein [Vibrio chemaguriensis]
MEMKKAQHPSRIFQASLAFGLLLVCAQFSSPVSAEEFLCQATQASEKELPMLEKTCPIGNGVWGKKVPQGGNYLYWIQCGLLPKPMSLAKAKPLYSKITTDVWMKPESKGYRCLIGPYKDLSDARGDLRGVKTLSNYKEAFIRVVGKENKQSTTPSKPAVPSKSAASSVKPTPTVTPKSAPVPAVRADTDAFTAPAEKSKTKVKNTRDNSSSKPAAKTKAKPVVSGNDDIEVRLRTSLQGKTYVVPYLLDHHNQFYMEYGKPWNRLNYENSQKVCQQLGMSLASPAEFKVLRASGVMEKNQWPLQLPYWGKGKKGLFADREPNQLTGTSLLNVVCVK